MRRDNPDSPEHYTYQRGVNRSTAFILIVLVNIYIMIGTYDTFENQFPPYLPDRAFFIWSRLAGRAAYFTLCLVAGFYWKQFFKFFIVPFFEVFKNSLLWLQGK